MSLFVPLRLSYQATIAPPAPSETIEGCSWKSVAVHRARPLAGQAGSAAPEGSTCWA
jgi:hypothetical protein